MIYKNKNLKTGSILFLIGLIFMAYGLARGENKIVERKSNIICLECIGLN